MGMIYVSINRTKELEGEARMDYAGTNLVYNILATK